MDNLSTAGLAVAAGVPPDVVLIALDAGLLAGHVRLVAGRPLYSRSAVSALERAAWIAERHAGAAIPFDEAWRLAKGASSEAAR